MFRLPTIHFQLDQWSFWIGFLAASLFWWVFSRLKGVVPLIQKRIQENREHQREKQQASVKAFMKEMTIQRIQSLHLAGELFPFDQVLIEPRLFGQPPQHGVDDAVLSESISSKIIPYIPDTPSLLSAMSFPTISLFDVVKSQIDIAIIGEPGAGKTTALNWVARQLFNIEITDSAIGKIIPFYIHIEDINIKKTSDPVAVLFDAVFQNLDKNTAKQVERHIFDIVNSENFLVLLDGLDELPEIELKEAIVFIRKLKKEYPSVHIITTADPYYYDGLIEEGFSPMSIAGWTRNQREDFLTKWATAWENMISSNPLQTQHTSQILIKNWLSSEINGLNPFDLTLKIWAAFAGDLEGPAPASAIQAFVTRKLGQNDDLKNIYQSAFDLIESNQTTINRTSISGSWISTLVANNFATSYANGTVAFSHPGLVAYFASQNATEIPVLQPVQIPHWSVLSKYLQYRFAISAGLEWLKELFPLNDAPVHRNSLLLLASLKDASASIPWKADLMRRVAQILQQESLPIGLRARFVSNLSRINDPSISALFRQLLTSTYPGVRQLAAMGCGAVKDPSAINDLIGVLNDPSTSVRLTAVLALASISTAATTRVLVELLLNGSEDLRQAAAEVFATDPKEGYEILKEAAGVEDILTRRAVVAGLIQVKKPWAKEMLEKMAVEDSQWVVRNAAAQGLEVVQSTSPYLPTRLPLPWESAWLLEFASKQGEGVTPGVMPVDLLIKALNDEKPENIIQALQYLKFIDEEGIIANVYKLYFGDENYVREAAQRAIWHLACSGAALPSTMAYGYA